MKVFLLRPNYNNENPMKVIGPKTPIGFGYLFSALEKCGHSVKIINGAVIGAGNETLVGMCKGADVVGVNSMSHYSREAADLCRKLKSAGYTVVIGGVHPTLHPEETLEDSGADFLIRGEGENTFPELLEFLAKGGTVSPVIISSPRIADLDSIPFPDWGEILQSHKHNWKIYDGLPYPNAVIISSRGCCGGLCLGSCTCYPMWQGRIYYRSPENIMLEIDYLKEKFNIKTFIFADQNISFNYSYFYEISRRISERKDINWKIGEPAHPDSIDEKMAKSLKESRCLELVLKYTGNPDKYLSAVRNASNADIPLEASICVGMGKENDKFIEEFLYLFKKLPEESILRMSITVPSRETKEEEIYEYMQKIKERIPSRTKTVFELFFKEGISLSYFDLLDSSRRNLNPPLS